MSFASTPPKIAIINTSDDLLDILQTLFEEHGYTVTTAHVRAIRTDLEDLQQFIERTDPDLLLWDLAPPYEQNWRYFQTIRHLPMMQGRRFVLTSTNERRAKEIAGEDKQVFEILGRPFDLDQLAAVVAKALAAPP